MIAIFVDSFYNASTEKKNYCNLTSVRRNLQYSENVPIPSFCYLPDLLATLFGKFEGK